MSRFVSWMTSQAYRKAWIVVIALLFIASYGAYSLTTVKQELIPDIEFPVAVVVAQNPGSQPEQIAQNVVAPIEAVTSTINGLKSTESTSVEGLGVILYSFEFGISPDEIEEELQSSVTTAVPDPAVQTSVLTFDPSTFPVVMFDLQGDLSQAELLSIAQTEIVPTLSAVDGVATVEVVGGAVDEIQITLDRQALLDRGISYEQIANTLQANNVVMPSGQVPNGDTTLPIQTVSLFNTIDEIAALPVQAPDGSGVRLDEIATIEEVPGRPIGYSRTDGEPSISIRVTKAQTANTVEVADRVTDAMEDLEGNLPHGASTSIFENQADYITESINALIEEGAIGGVLAVIIVFLFLRNWRTTLVTAVSIPLSIVGAIIVLNRFDYSLNIMTLAGLTIAIGRVIDDTIVVLENVYRHMAAGEEPFQATIRGSREVAIAIIGATATTCAVFLPLGLVGGLIGELFLPFALAVTAALIASLLVAVLVVPVLVRFTLAGRVKAEPDKSPATSTLNKIYTPVLTWALRHRWTTLIIAGVMFIGSMALVPLLPVTFLPDAGENTITVSVNARPGQTAESVLDQAIAVEGLLGEVDAEGFQTVITGASGDFGAIGNIISGNSPNSASITVELPSGMDKQDAADELRTLIAEQVEGSETITVSAGGGGFAPSGIQITLAADSAAAAANLPEFTAQVAEAVGSVDETANVASNLSAVQQTVEVQINTLAAAEAGLTPAQISASLANLSANQTVTTANLESGPRPIRLVLSGGDASSIEELNQLEIAPGVLLNEVAELVEVPKQVSITRVDGRPAATVSADITGENVGGISAEVAQAVDELETPAGVEVLVGGVAGDIEQGFADMFIAIIISIVLVYAIMGLLFQSWLDPFVILFTLPLAAIGAIIALLVTGSALSLSALIGMMMLVGIVVTNAIVMLEFVIMLRKERGYSTYDALVEGAQTRLRPILMTAFAAMLALVPLSLGLTEGLLIAADLGRVVIGGLFTSTLLTLLVVPVVYSLVDGLKVRFGHHVEHEPAPATSPGFIRLPAAPNQGDE